MKGNLTGLVLSAFIHTGLFLLLIYSVTTDPTPKKTEQAVPLRLAMFQEAEPIVEAKPKVASKPAPIAKIVKKTKPKPKKVIKKKKLKKKIKKKPTKPKKSKQKKKHLVKTITKQAAPKLSPIIHQTIAKQPKAKPRPKVRKTPQPIVKSRNRPKTIKPIKKSNIKAAEQQYKSRLHQLIAKHKKYPTRAKRKHEEGTVTLSFTIYANGQIQNIRIIHSSGSNSLDQAAIKAVKQVSNRLPFPAQITRKQWQFTLPLVYNLH